MKLRVTIIAAMVILAGCTWSSFGVNNPIVINPTVAQWNAAYGGLTTDERLALRDVPRVVPLNNTIDNRLYSFGYGPPRGRPLQMELLNIAGICDGYNARFASKRSGVWRLLSATTFVQDLNTETGGIFSTFGLYWRFERSGKTISVSMQDSGRDLTQIWGNSDALIAEEANEAFASAFLKLILRLNRAAH